MNIKEYLEKEKVDLVELAYKAKITTASIYFYLKGRKPQQKVAERIEKATNGLVTVMELRGKDDRIQKVPRGCTYDQTSCPAN